MRQFSAALLMTILQLLVMFKFKSYVGLKGAFRKFEHWLNDFETMSLQEADAGINWEETKVVVLGRLDDQMTRRPND